MTPLSLFLLLFTLLQGIPLPHRPRDPWVFRSVLDQKARMVTLALSDEMWAAYDCTSCALYKVWKGGVHFDGAVYTTVHGPQPTSQGQPYTVGASGDPWSASVNGRDVAVKLHWRGYTLHAGRATLNYDIQLPDGRMISMQETPEYILSHEAMNQDALESFGVMPGAPGFLRSFFADEIPEGVVLYLKVRTDGALAKIPAEGFAREEVSESALLDGQPAKQTVSYFTLGHQRKEANMTLFFEPLPTSDTGGEEKPKKEEKKR